MNEHSNHVTFVTETTAKEYRHFKKNLNKKFACRNYNVNYLEFKGNQIDENWP